MERRDGEEAEQPRRNEMLSLRRSGGEQRQSRDGAQSAERSMFSPRDWTRVLRDRLAEEVRGERRPHSETQLHIEAGRGVGTPPRGRASATVEIERDQSFSIQQSRMRIDELYVYPPYRAEGHDQTMLAKIEDEGRRYGATEVYGHADPGDQDSRRLYERSGYQFRFGNGGHLEAHKSLDPAPDRGDGTLPVIERPASVESARERPEWERYDGEMREVPLRDLPPTEGIDGPQDFRGGGMEEMIGDMHRVDEIRQTVARGDGCNSAYWEQIDQQRGLDPARGYRHTYDLFYGGDAIRVDRTPDGYDIVNGRHRIWLGRKMGIERLPMRVV